MGRSGEGREGDGGGLGWGGVWAGHVFFFTFVLGALPGVTFFLHVFGHLCFTFVSRFFHVLRRLYVHVFFSRFFFTFSLGKREKK